MNLVVGMVWVWCCVALGVSDGLAAEALASAPPSSQLEQALKDLSSDEEATREQAISLLIEQGDATSLARLEELRVNADRSLRMAIKPVAGMTDEETEQTGRLLQSLAEKHAIIVIEHDMDLVRQIARTVTVLHEWTVICEGSVEQVQADPRVVEIYLGRQKVAHV